jgi:hypothetical protein
MDRDFANRTRYILSELDNIEAGRPVKYPAQIPDYRKPSREGGEFSALFFPIPYLPRHHHSTLPPRIPPSPRLHLIILKPPPPPPSPPPSPKLTPPLQPATPPKPAST